MKSTLKELLIRTESAKSLEILERSPEGAEYLQKSRETLDYLEELGHSVEEATVFLLALLREVPLEEADSETAAATLLALVHVERDANLSEIVEIQSGGEMTFNLDTWKPEEKR